MESASEFVAVLALGMAVAMFGVLVDRRRKHLKMVVRVIDRKDQNMLDFLQDLVAKGELAPAHLK